ncbi:MAG: hypothetical protein ABL921_05890 [Pirellula sp.]
MWTADLECLESRSVYFVFFDWTIIHEEYDDDVVTEMRDLFARALCAMTINRYRESVEDRCRDFERICERIKNNNEIVTYSTF